MYDDFGPKKQEESAYKCLSVLFCDAKNIQGIEWYNLGDHMMSLFGYMQGKLRKIGFLKNLNTVHFWRAKKPFWHMLRMMTMRQRKTGGKCLQMSFIAFLWCKNIQGMNDMIYVTIRCLYVATCQENEEKLDFWKKILRWLWYNTSSIKYMASFSE